ncbi:MAG: hypothetical protein HRU30_21215 [Rhodobacteraceae bacterium]|nr:hypothetical protein [Paracoccaceae bacterium]
MTRSDLENRLLEFDGVAVTILSEAREACGEMADYWPELVRLSPSSEGHISAAATWIIKAELEDGATPPAPALANLISALSDISAWQAQLHLCQCLHLASLSTDQARAAAKWATGFAIHKRPFLRAWSLNLRAALGVNHAVLAKDGQKARETALADTAASVRARARHMPG